MAKKTKQVTIHTAKTHLSKLIKELAGGTEIIIASGQTPVAKLIQFNPPHLKRLVGWARGKIKMSEDFNEPLPDFEEYM